MKEAKWTFYQWLNAYEFMTKREFKELPKYKQDNYRMEYKMFMQEKSQYNQYEEETK